MKGELLKLRTVGMLAAFLLIGGMAGCATGNSEVLPASLEERLAAEATADDYLKAARLYEERADSLRTKAARFEERADALAEKPYLDPKGLKRDSLSRLAGSYRGEAREMEQRYAFYQAKARTFMSRDNNGREAEGSGS